jgi:hypothetical protein
VPTKDDPQTLSEYAALVENHSRYTHRRLKRAGTMAGILGCTVQRSVQMRASVENGVTYGREGFHLVNTVKSSITNLKNGFVPFLDINAPNAELPKKVMGAY